MEPGGDRDMFTTRSGREVPRDPLECYVLKEHFVQTHKREVDTAKPVGDTAQRSGEYVVEVMAEEDKPSREEVVKAREARKLAKKEGKKHGGGHKQRPVTRIDRSEQLCSCLTDVSPGAPGPECNFPKCRMQHDVAAFLKKKPADHGPSCHVFTTFGYCPRGLACRFSGQHIDSEGRNVRQAGWRPLEDQTSGRLDKAVQTDLRKRNYEFQLADRVCQEAWDTINSREKLEGKLVTDKCASEQTGEDAPSKRWEKKVKLDDGSAAAAGVDEAGRHGAPGPRVGPVSDDDLVRLRPGEGRRPLDWAGKAYLAPLTTVGNLPFRRVCKELGADITCGEMALTLPLLQGHTPEWALTKRHHSEDFFGIQVAGCSPPQMARLAQLVEERVDCDFVDINMGCPIDLLFKQGMGSGLMGRRRPMEAIVRSMSRILSCPLTVKMRTGIYSDKHVAHQLFPLVEQWGAAALTLHGRSKEQRYTRLADWDYIGQARATVTIPVFGNGDVMNYEDFNLQRARSGVAGVMLARGALIKPWVFTEIREQRHWDISGQERLDIVRDYCNFGLEHWGSDDKGVETTRRFLLEWLSFTHRYVPHGIVLFPPQRIHERAPLFSGRTELESLLSSPDCGDWVKITEMFLGKVRDDFVFLPKHKANSYS